MGSPAAFVQLLAIQCLFLRFCLAATFQTLGLDSGLYIFDIPKAIRDGQYATTNGNIVVSFRGSLFLLQGPYNPSATLSLYVDGQHRGTQPDGYFSEVSLEEGDHQILIVVQAPASSPYIFRGIGLPVFSGVNLNATKDYIPQTYGVNASVVPSNTKILDNTNTCVTYSEGWSQSSDWKSYNGSLALSNDGASGMTIYFFGTSIWLFSSQGSLKFPQLASLSGTIDSEDITDLPPASFTAMDTDLTQKLLWSRTNLTNAVHVLKIYFSHSYKDIVSFDFARVEQEMADCKLLVSQSTNHPLSWDTMEILLLVCASSLFPIFFISCICFFAGGRAREVLRDKKSQRYSGQSAGGQKLDISDDSSSFRTILNRTRRAGLRGARLRSSNDDHPRAMTFPQVMVTPFGPVVLGENEEPYRAARRRNSKNPDIHPRPTSVTTGDATTDTVSESMESDAETGSQISSSSPIPPILDLILPQRHSDSSLSPPPSYRTELQSRRLAGQARLLTQEDLGRLVDRVTALRGWGRPPDTTSLRVENPTIDEEDDAVEMLARQIVESGTSASEGTRIRTVKDIE